MTNAIARSTPASAISRTVSSRNGRQFLFPQYIGQVEAGRADVGEQLAALGVDRADPADGVVVLGDLGQPLGRGRRGRG